MFFNEKVYAIKRIKKLEDGVSRLQHSTRDITGLEMIESWMNKELKVYFPKLKAPITMCITHTGRFYGAYIEFNTMIALDRNSRKLFETEDYFLLFKKLTINLDPLMFPKFSIRKIVAIILHEIGHVLNLPYLNKRMSDVWDNKKIWNYFNLRRIKDSKALSPIRYMVDLSNLYVENEIIADLFPVQLGYGSEIKSVCKELATMGFFKKPLLHRHDEVKNLAKNEMEEPENKKPDIQKYLKGLLDD